MCRSEKKICSQMLKLSTDFSLSEKISMNNDLKPFGRSKRGTVGCPVSAVGKVQTIFLINSHHSLTWRTPLRSHSTLDFTSSATISYKAHFKACLTMTLFLKEPSKCAVGITSGCVMEGYFHHLPWNPKNKERSTCSNHLKFFFCHISFVILQSYWGNLIGSKNHE